MRSVFEGKGPDFLAELQRSITVDEVLANPFDPTIPHLLLDSSPDRLLTRREARRLRQRRRALYWRWVGELRARTAGHEPEIRRLHWIGWMERFTIRHASRSREAIDIVRSLARAQPPGGSAVPLTRTPLPPSPHQPSGFCHQVRDAMATGDRHAYFRLLGKMNARGQRVLRHQRLKTRSCSLEVCIREEMEFRWLMHRLWWNGVVHFAGIRRDEIVMAIVAQAASLTGSFGDAEPSVAV